MGSDEDRASRQEGRFRDLIDPSGPAWPASAVAAEVEPHLQRVVDAAGGFDRGGVPAVAIRDAMLAFAVVGPDGAIRAADAAFPLQAGSLPPSIAALLRQARGGEPAFGVVESSSGAVIAICAAKAAAAAAWPLGAPIRAALGAPAQVVLMAFRPPGHADIARQAAATFGLSVLEARAATALLEAPSIEVVASRLGVGPATARGALNGAMRKVGVRRTPALARRMIELICAAPPTADPPVDVDGDVLGEVMDLTPAQARVARLSARGATIADVARDAGLSPQTVKSHLHSIFGKAGVGRAKDLGRLDVELRTLQALACAGEVVAFPEEAEGRLRIVARREDGRRVAFIDYGGRRGARPLLVFHALASGRTLPPGLAARLRAAGYRAIIPQRPGYGLTDPHGRDDYLSTAADDVAAILDALKLAQADLFARDIAAAATVALAQRHPERLGRVLLLNPETPYVPHRARPYAISAAAHLLQKHPEITGPFFEVLRRQTRTARLARLVVESFRNGAPSDVEAVHTPEILGWMVRDMQAMVARSMRGPVSERLAYADGWRPPTVAGGGAWTIARSRELGGVRAGAWWSELAGARVIEAPVGGLLLAASHPQALVGLLAEA
jgi:pimeloyl-ACP methyl ester carboxylesterase/DNA-binding CsgD family transcriptional regulator